MNLPINIHQVLGGPSETPKRLGKKAKDFRLFQGLKRVTLSKKSGVSAETIRNFEQTGKINLENFIRIAFALHEEHKLSDLFELPEIASLQEIEKRSKPLPKRGKR